MAKPKAKPVMMYMGPIAEDGLGRVIHQFRAEVCGRIAGVNIPIPKGAKFDDDLREEAKRAAAAAFANLERDEMARVN